MLKLTVLSLLLCQLAQHTLAAPSPNVARGLTCEESVKLYGLAAGTVCKMEGGVPVRVASAVAVNAVEATAPVSAVGSPSTGVVGTPVLGAAPTNPAAGTPSTSVVGTSVLGAAPTTPAVDGAGVAGPARSILTHVPIEYINGTAAWPSGVSSGSVPVLTAAAQKPLAASTNKDGKRFVAYWSAWHGTGKEVTDLPSPKHLKGVTHLILAFWDPRYLDRFFQSGNTAWGIDIAALLKKQKSDMKVIAAFGGWGWDEFFRHNATDANRDKLAQQFVDFVKLYQLDGIDVDWEYPVDFGETYKTSRTKGLADLPNNVLLMQAIRIKLDKLKETTKKDYTLSLAVPGIKNDMAAYNAAAVKEIDKVVDFWNLMSYDMINRRSKKTGHHGGGAAIEANIANYYFDGQGVDKKKLNIGFPMYAKWFYLKNAQPKTDCTVTKYLDCNMGENTFEFTNGTAVTTLVKSSTGEDIMMPASGSLMYNSALNSPEALGAGNHALMEKGGIFAAWTRVQSIGKSDPVALATAAFDELTQTFFTWLTPADTAASCSKYLPDVGGIMVWSIDQDDAGADGGSRFQKLQDCIGAK